MTYPQFKRICDLVFSVIFLVLLLPLMAGVGVLALVFQGRPIFFLQVRPGIHERPFKLLKFRTMASNLNAFADRYPHEHVTRFGRILRTLSLDELPQLVNIVRGDMSFVGPRPLLMEYLPLYSDEQKRRHNVRPGLTGLAQIQGRNLVPWERRLALDVMYVESQSFAVDIDILLKSVVLVLVQLGVRAEGSESMPRFRGNGLSGVD